MNPKPASVAVAVEALSSREVPGEQSAQELRLIESYLDEIVKELILLSDVE